MNFFRVNFLSIVLITTSCLNTQQAFARAGDLDGSFGTNGRVDLSTLDGHSLIGTIPIAVTPQGKILFTAAYVDSFDLNNLVGRLNSDGSVDSSFGVNGITPLATQAEGGEPVKVIADKQNNLFVLLQPNAIGTSHVIKLQPDGSVATDFGNGGIANLPGESVTPYGMTLDSQGRVLITGLLSTNTASLLYVSRLLPNGAPDTSFHNEGWSASILTKPSTGWSINEDTHHNIVISGSLLSPGNGAVSPKNAMVARLTEPGELDTSFANGGVFDSGVYGVAAGDNLVNADNSVLFTGILGAPNDSTISPNKNIAVWKLTASGELDASFGSAGAAIIKGNGASQGLRLAKTKSGKILVAGQYNAKASLARFQSNGQPDSSYGSAGIAALPGSNQFATSLALQKDDKALTSNESVISRTQAGSLSILGALLISLLPARHRKAKRATKH